MKLLLLNDKINKKKETFLILYHGTSDRIVKPQFGLGNERHDYGKGFYLTDNINLAKEWAVCKPESKEGYVHMFELDLTDLQLFDFTQHNVLIWLAELMKHREASDSKRYRILSEKFIQKYGLDLISYDVLCGWRANASYFYIAKEFVRDNIDIAILDELLLLGGLGIQYCIKSEFAFSKLTEYESEMTIVDYKEFNLKYNQRDVLARKKMKELIDSDKNKVEKVFSTMI